MYVKPGSESVISQDTNNRANIAFERMKAPGSTWKHTLQGFAKRDIYIGKGFARVNLQKALSGAMPRATHILFVAKSTTRPSALSMLSLIAHLLDAKPSMPPSTHLLHVKPSMTP